MTTPNPDSTTITSAVNPASAAASEPLKETSASTPSTARTTTPTAEVLALASTVVSDSTAPAASATMADVTSAAVALTAVTRNTVIRPTRRVRRPLTIAAASALTGLALLGLAACGGNGRTAPATKNPVPLPSPTTTKQEVSEKNLGYIWPLTVDHGTAECRQGDQAVITVADGTTYALNDRAREAGYKDIAPVRAAGHGGDKVSLGSLLSKTMKLCRIGR